MARIIQSDDFQMTSRTLITGILFTGILLLTSCAFLSAGDATPEVQEYRSEPGIPESPVIYTDDFSGTDGGWTQASTNSGSSVAYSHEGLEFIINESEKDYWSTRNGEYGNIGVGVDASKLGGPDDNTLGVICRFKDPGNYYAFLISSDGYYGILKVKDGTYTLLSGKNMDYDAGIVRGRGTNRVLGICSQDMLGLFVNGKLLTIVQDTDLTEGKIGLIAGTTSSPGTDILFDNLILYQQ